MTQIKYKKVTEEDEDDYEESQDETDDNNTINNDKIITNELTDLSTITSFNENFNDSSKFFNNNKSNTTNT